MGTFDHLSEGEKATLATHQIASDAARHILMECDKAGVGWVHTAACLETTITITLRTLAVVSATPDQKEFIKEILTLMTDRVLARAYLATDMQEQSK